MRQVFTIAVTFIALNVSGQTARLKVPLVGGNTQTQSGIDTILKVTYVTSDDSDSPAYYLNGQFVNETLLKTLNPEVIADIKVSNQEIKVGSRIYYGEIFIKTKADYTPDLISLTDLKSKYTDLKNTPIIIMIDNEVIHGDYDKCIVDENFLLKISVEKIENARGKLKFSLIQILTKTEENIKKSKEIRIRGNFFNSTESF